jgi:hypothetical protein
MRFYELTVFEKAMLRQMFRAVLESGTAPSVTFLHKALQTYRLRIVRTLGKLGQKHRLVRKKDTGEIVCLYPLSLVPTEHQVIIDGEKRLFANSALDALGVPHMFNKNVEIVSQCATCKQTIAIRITNGNVASTSHPRIYLWSPMNIQASAVAQYSRFMNFFCTEEHGNTWMRENHQPMQIGHSRPLEQEYSRIRDYWMRYGRTVGTR